MNTIYNVPGGQGEMNSEQCLNEARQNNIEKKFVTATVELVINVLDIGHKDRRMFQSLLENAIANQMNTRYKNEGLLQQYEAYVLELAGERITNELDIPKEVKINHKHATHAKYADIADYLKAEDKKDWLTKFNKKGKTV